MLKRIYGSDGKVDHFDVWHTGTRREQNFSRQLVEVGLAQGWILIEGERLTLRASPEYLVYRILRGPGYYCLHCGSALPSDLTGQGARAHIAEVHRQASTSPDPQWPLGYRVSHAYECLLDEGQHEKFKSRVAGQKVS